MLLLSSLIAAQILMTTPQSYDTLIANALNRVEKSGVQKDFKRSEVAVSLINLADSSRGEVNGEQQFLTASVVKLFWLAFAAHRIDRNEVSFSAEFKRAARDMIVDSSNDATGYIVSATTFANPGPELPDAEFKIWLSKRQAANVWFKSLGFQNINVLHRTYNEEAYGVEKQAWGSDNTLRNKLTTNATARLMAEIFAGKVGSKATNKWMLSLLSRSIPADDKNADAQSKGYIGAALPSGSKLWSKAGWTSINRHDVAAFELPDGRKFVLAIFTNYGANDKIVPAIAKEIIAEL